MEKYEQKERFWASVGLVLLAVVVRLIPHPPNFVPIGGLALFSGVHFSGKKSYFIPLSAMLISDLLLGIHPTMIFVYVSFLLMVLVGKVIKNDYRLSKLFAAAVSSSLLFFIITNFGVWLTTDFYPHTWQGLVSCYQMAIPFFRNTLFGDLFFSFSFFYGYEFLLDYSKKVMSRQKKHDNGLS